MSGCHNPRMCRYRCSTGEQGDTVSTSSQAIGILGMKTLLTNSTHNCCYSGKVIVAKLELPPSSHVFMFFIPGPVEGQSHLPQQESLKKCLQHSPINANHTIEPELKTNKSICCLQLPKMHSMLHTAKQQKTGKGRKEQGNLSILKAFHCLV